MKHHPVRIWAWFFLVSALLFDIGGGTNASSRYATLSALVEDRSFSINHYLADTGDWCQTPDGNFYSNKPPLPTLVAFPLFWVLDKIVNINADKRSLRDSRRRFLRFTFLKLFAFLFHVIPFLVMGWVVVEWVGERGGSVYAQHAVASTLWMGSTASLLMNTYFGHPMAALFIMFSFFCGIHRKFAWAGFGFGMAVLSDYGAGLVGIPMGFTLLMVSLRNRNHSFLRWIAGGIVPGLIWAWFHYTVYGNWLTTPMAFQNPEFQTIAETGAPWGQFHTYLPWDVVVALLFGTSRGILWTNTWVFFVVGAGFLSRTHRLLWINLLLSLGLLFGMTASFGGWHGGHTIGPRYLSSILPAFVIWIGLAWDGLPKWVRTLGMVSIAIPIALNTLILLTGAVPVPGQGLWEFYADRVIHPNSTVWVRLVAASLGMGAGWVFFRRQLIKTFA